VKELDEFLFCFGVVCIVGIVTCVVGCLCGQSVGQCLSGEREAS